MSASPDDFNELKKLIACKRYEQPPPGYFNHFSDHVISRIEVEEFRSQPGWWGRLFERLETKPLLACAYGVAVSSLLFVGFKLSEIFEHEVAEAPAIGGLGLAGLPNQSAFPAAFGSVGTFERSAVAYSTSLSPAFRQEPPEQWYRASPFRVQAIGFSYNP